MNIKRLLIITVSIIIIILTASVTTLSCVYFENSMLDSISSNRQDSLRLISQKVDNIVNSAYTISNLISQNESITGTLLCDSMELIDQVSLNTQINQIYMQCYSAFSQVGISFSVICFGENGFRYSSETAYDQDNYARIKTYSWFNKNVNNHVLSYTVPNITYNVTNFTKAAYHGLAVVRNIYKPDGSYAGSVLVCIPEEILRSAYASVIDPKSQNQIYILNDLSVTISCNDPKLLGSIPFKLPDYCFIRGNERYSIYEMDGKEYLGAKYTSDLTNWTVFEQIPLYVIKAPINAMLSGIILLGVLICGASILLAMLVSAYISKPLLKFCGDIKSSMQSGLIPISVPSSLSEINTLESCFNNLTGEVKALMATNQQKEAAVNAARLSFLKAQINPHFLYNSLFSIKCTVANNHPEQACEMITLLVSFLRASISSDSDEHTLLDESVYLSQYVKLLSLRYDNGLRLDIRLPDSLLHVRILRFIIQPLVENAILYGEQEGDARAIGLLFTQEGGKLIIKVCNNGKRFTQEDLDAILLSTDASGSGSASTHIGLKNANDRIKLHYGPDYGLYIGSDGAYTTAVCIQLPIIQEGPCQLS